MKNKPIIFTIKNTFSNLLSKNVDEYCINNINDAIIRTSKIVFSAALYFILIFF